MGKQITEHETRKRSIRAGGITLAVLASIIGLALPAAAAAGDVTLNHTATYSELRTNQCNAGWGQTILYGGPFPANTDFVVTGGGTQSACRVRVRVAYVTSINGPVQMSPYYSASGTGTNGFTVLDAYRCYTEVGVRRTDGTYFTRFQIAGSAAEAGCPS